jgi:regulation of enolase protein 1 (concanavalin A-like superfamily)
MTTTQLQPLNTTKPPPTAISFPFTLHVSPSTDLWLKPPSLATPASPPIIAHNQPSFVQNTTHASFLRAKAVVSFVPTHLYDQGGLVLLYPKDDRKWVKAGLEYTNGKTERSVVIAGTGRGADWSISPHLTQGDAEGRVKATVEFEREGAGEKGGELGGSLFVKVNGEIVRECTWVFAVGETGPLQVGFYGARPAKGDIGDLEVRVEMFEVEERSVH